MANLVANLRANLRDNSLYISSYFWGGMDAYWLAWAEFAERIGVPIKDEEHFHAYINYAKTCGVGYFYPGFAFVSDRPELIRKDDETKLHCEDGPALRFRDGYSVHAWHGRNVPAKWIEEKATIDPSEVLKCSDVELRATGCSILGMHRMLDNLRHTIIDSHEDPQCGDLIEIWMPDLPESELYLKFHCPRNGEMMEPVNKRELTEPTLHHAHAWHAGVPARLFSYAQQRS